eukprot:scaffold154_cov129-Cylindrotheca_fusiformis.AAC.27
MSNDENIETEVQSTEVKMEDASTDKPVEESQQASVKDDSDTAEVVEDKEATKRKAEEDRKKKEELQKKYANWPLRNIKDPHDNDVMYGRGGGTNHHPGNKRYRKMVEDRKLEYVNSKRLDKPLVALDIIRVWRAQLPPGRFLKLDEKSGLWNDVGDKKAREKTSQALREKAPLIRKQQEDENDVDEEKSSKKGDDVKTTRFAAGTKEESSKAKKPVLARDHSLGREYIQQGESVSLEGFSWQDPFQGDAAKRTSSYGTQAAPAAPGPYAPAGRHSSSGSLGIAPPQHGGPPPPPPDYYGRVGSDRHREYSNGRYDSWSAPFAYPPPPPPPAVQGPIHQRSGSWTNAPPPPQVPHHQRSGSWSGRDNSLAFNPLIGASVAHPADRRAFESRASSGYWAGAYRSPPRHTSPTNSTPSPKPTYTVDMDIARSWSNGSDTAKRTWAMDQDGRQAGAPSYNRQIPQPISGTESSPMRTAGVVPRPQIVKRDTSHQNESMETKHSVKRAALNRDNSLASNRLKAEFMPEYFNENFNHEQEVKKLSDNLEQSTLASGKKSPAKPQPLNESGRISTFDFISTELMSRPEPLSDRVSTIDALGLDLEVDPEIDQKQLKLENPMEDEMNGTKSGVPKPKAMTADNRLTTSEFLEIVNAPMGEDTDDDPLDLGKAPSDHPPPLNQEKISENWLTSA